VGFPLEFSTCSLGPGRKLLKRLHMYRLHPELL